jgi:hypothetical protein
MSIQEDTVKVLIAMRPNLNGKAVKDLDIVQKRSLYANELYNDCKDLDLVVKCLFPDPGLAYIEDQLKIAFSYTPDTIIS